MPADLQQIWSRVDINQCGKVNLIEFVAATMEPRVFCEPALFKAAFRVLDADGDGWITQADIEALLHEDVAAHMREERAAAEAAMALSNAEAASVVGPAASTAAAEERLHEENAHEREELHEAYHNPREATRKQLKDRPGKTRRLKLQEPSDTPKPAAPPPPRPPATQQATVLDC